MTLGIGAGWSREELEALGVPSERRGARTTEYVAALRAVCGEEVASFAGAFVRFDAIRVNPKPLRGRIPIVLGGNSDVAEAGDSAHALAECWGRARDRIG